MPLSDFYTGAMAPPTSVNGKLVPSSLAGMYSEVLPAAPASGLVSRKVNTVDIDEATGNPVPTGGTTYYPKGPTYGYNALTGDYEVQQPGNAYAAGGGKPNFDYASNPAAAAINTAAPSIAAMYGRPSMLNGYAPAALMNQYEPNGMPIDNDRPLNLSEGGGGQTAPSGGGRAPVAPAAPVAPQSPIQTLAAMFTPAKPAKVGYNGSKTMRSGDVAGGSGSIFGENAVLPPSMNNERWNTGY